MATVTKAALAAENAALRQQVAELTKQVEALAHMAAPQIVREAFPNTKLRPQWQVERAAAMQAARAQAMASRSVVRV